MLELQNKTAFQAQLFPALTKHAEELLLVIVKGTFTFERGAVRPADEQVPVTAADVHYGEPAKSSVKYEADTCPPKLGTDVVLVGQAHSARPATALDVGLSVGPLRKLLRVTGDRLWYQGPMGWRMTPPNPFRSMPLTYELAFGGADTVHPNPAKHDFERRNPIGTGFVGSGGKERTEHLRVPNVEDPAALIQSPSDRPAPAGVGWIGRHWLPRSTFGGTYDARWREERAPLLPLDFDESFYSGASAGLVARPYLRGGEPVRLLNCSPDGETVDFKLPAVGLQVEAVIRGNTSTAVPLLDTVLIEPDEHRVALTWRAAIPCTRNFLNVERVTVAPST